MCLSVLCLLCLCARLFICALWSPVGKGLTSWLLGQVWYLIVSIPYFCTLTYKAGQVRKAMNMPKPLGEEGGASQEGNEYAHNSWRRSWRPGANVHYYYNYCFYYHYYY